MRLRSEIEQYSAPIILMCVSMGLRKDLLLPFLWKPRQYYTCALFNASSFLMQLAIIRHCFMTLKADRWYQHTRYSTRRESMCSELKYNASWKNLMARAVFQ